MTDLNAMYLVGAGCLAALAIWAALLIWFLVKGVK